MAIYFATDSAAKLLHAIRLAISEGRITTWTCDADGDFTHNPPQWKNKAWLRPKPLEKHLAIYIIAPRTKGLSRETYAVYHGRFVEVVLAHFDEMFSRADVTAMPQMGDNVRG